MRKLAPNAKYAHVCRGTNTGPNSHHPHQPTQAPEILGSYRRARRALLDARDPGRIASAPLVLLGQGSYARVIGPIGTALDQTA